AGGARLATRDAAAGMAAERGILARLHREGGTMGERPDEVQRVLDGCTAALCLDSGHLLIGGTDPAELARQAPGRVAHAHLKDVDAGWAGRVRRGEGSYTEAVASGMYRPLGQGGGGGAGPVRAPAGG